MTHELRREGDERYEQNRRELADEIARRIPFGIDPGDPEGGVLTVWATIAEFEASNGERWLSVISGTGSGRSDLPLWTLRALGRELRDYGEPADQEEDEDA